MTIPSLESHLNSFKSYSSLYFYINPFWAIYPYRFSYLDYIYYISFQNIITEQIIKLWFPNPTKLRLCSLSCVCQLHTKSSRYNGAPTSNDISSCCQFDLVQRNPFTLTNQITSLRFLKFHYGISKFIYTLSEFLDCMKPIQVFLTHWLVTFHLRKVVLYIFLLPYFMSRKCKDNSD